MVLNPRESGKLIASLASHVKIKREGVEKLGEALIEEVKKGRFSTGNFTQPDLHPSKEQDWNVDWLFVVNSLNFCFWAPEKEPSWTVENQHGYYALCAAINRAMREGIDILNPHYYSTITESQLTHILRSSTRTSPSLVKERVECLHSSGKVLIEKYQSSFRNVLEKANHSAVKLLQLIVADFPYFCDEADYRGHRVALYKRAQILVGDVWCCLQGKDLADFSDIGELTMFPDYRVPQSLIYYEVLEYSEELMQVLKEGRNLENGDEMEVEIRGCSIHAVEQARDYVKQKGYEVNSVFIDHYLWEFRRNNATKIYEMGIPFHKTRCIYY